MRLTKKETLDLLHELRDALEEFDRAWEESVTNNLKKVPAVEV